MCLAMNPAKSKVCSDLHKALEHLAKKTGSNTKCFEKLTYLILKLVPAMAGKMATSALLSVSLYA